MRAYLSTFGRRQTSVRDGYASDAQAYGAMAEREARAILAKTEPFRRGGTADTWPPTWYVLPGRDNDDTGASRAARRALAEALAAFVGP